MAKGTDVLAEREVSAKVAPTSRVFRTTTRVVFSLTTLLPLSPSSSLSLSRTTTAAAAGERNSMEEGERAEANQRRGTGREKEEDGVVAGLKRSTLARLRAHACVCV